MKKGEAAAYAEAQVKGTAWLPSLIRPASVPAPEASETASVHAVCGAAN